MTEEPATTLRRCIGSARYGIAPHEAPIEDFPRQPSQRDGLGRMCKVHWNAYTAGLARNAKARKAAAEQAQEPVRERASEPAPRRRRELVPTPEPGAQGDAG